MQSAFEDVKEAILTSAALAMFDPSLPTTVTTDASDVGIGAVLTQTHPGGERVVAFASSKSDCFCVHCPAPSVGTA